MKKSNLAIVALLAFVVVSAGCLDSDKESNDGFDYEQPDDASQDGEDTERPPREILIKNDGKSFVPENVQVEKGREIVFIFERTSGAHSLRIPELEKGTSTLSYDAKRNFTVTFEEEGEYEFICSVGTHAEDGMRGTITVT